MTPILDPRDGDIEDDAASTKRRSMLSLAGTLLAEISLPKLVVVWILLIGIPGLLLGAAPLLVSIWIASVLSKASNIFSEFWPVLLLPLLVALGWFLGRPLLRLAENSFWSLNALAVQPVYVVFREGLQHLVEHMLALRATAKRRAAVRAGTAAVSGVAICALGFGLVLLVWPASRWVGHLAEIDLSPRLVLIVMANSVVLISGYFAVAGLIWGIADATMAQPKDLPDFATPTSGGRKWRVVHLSDIHTVGESYGFRIESGRSGPRGNERMRQAFLLLDAIHAANPLDIILITGDLTDAGRSAEWAEFFAMLALHPRLAELVVALPGNHDVNVVDRASPARMDLPTSPAKRLRQVRTISALELLQGTRLNLIEAKYNRIGSTLADALKPYAAAMIAFADTGSAHLSRSLAGLWAAIFPMVLEPDTDDGLGIIGPELQRRDAFFFHQRAGACVGRAGASFQSGPETVPKCLLDRGVAPPCR